MKDFDISERLKYIAGRVKKGSIAADIGTDHGYLPIYLVKNDICNKVIAMDVRKGPLEKAKNNVLFNNVLDNVDLRLSDGLEMLNKDETDVVIIAGMGGKLIRKILLQGREKLSSDTRLILSPQSELEEFRDFLDRECFIVTSEHMMIEEGQYYVIIECRYMKEKYNYDIIKKTYLKYGRELLINKNSSLYELLNKEEKSTKELINKLKELPQQDIVGERINELENDMKCINLAKEFYI